METDIQTGAVYENEYMSIVVSEVTEHSVVYSDGSAAGTERVPKAKFQLKMMAEDFELVEDENDDEEEASEVRTGRRSRRGRTRQMISNPFHDRSAETAMDGRGPRGW